MSRQIRIAQSLADEEELARFLAERYEVVALPRVFKERVPEPQPLGKLRHERQVIFFIEHWPHVESQIHEVVDSPRAGGSQFTVRTSRLAVEWNRTQRRQDGDHMAGRLYLNLELARPSIVDAVGDAWVAPFERMASFVKRSSPLRTPGRIPIWIGRSLATRIDAGEARLVYPNGLPVPLEDV
jgi:hypothetical protein